MPLKNDKQRSLSQAQLMKARAQDYAAQMSIEEKSIDDVDVESNLHSIRTDGQLVGGSLSLPRIAGNQKLGALSQQKNPISAKSRIAGNANSSHALLSQQKKKLRAPQSSVNTQTRNIIGSDGKRVAVMSSQRNLQQPSATDDLGINEKIRHL